MPLAWLDVGSNIDRDVNVQEAVRRLREAFRVHRTSSIYESPAAVGPPGQPPFYNLVVAVETPATPETLRTTLRGIEAAMGRVRTAEKWAPRRIDLDLVLYDDLVRKGEGWELPHPSLLQDAYVLVPLCELEPQRRHPVTGMRFCDILASLPPYDVRRVAAPL